MSAGGSVTITGTGNGSGTDNYGVSPGYYDIDLDVATGRIIGLS